MRPSLRVLLVEDSADDAALMLRALRRSGFDVASERVETGADLERALDAGGWQVVLSDYSLPSFGGLEALAIVQRRGLDLPFVVVSGTITDEMAVAAMRAGAHDYVLKDNLARLGAVVSRELREAEVRQRRRVAEAELESLKERSAAELKRSRDQLDAVLRGVAEAIVAQDADGRVVYANDAALHALGASDGVAFADVFAPFEIRDTEGRVVRAQDLVPAEPADGGAEVEVSLRHRRSGEGRWFIVAATPIRDEHGRVRSTIAILRDITERKRAEMALRFLADAGAALASSLDLATTVSTVAQLAVQRVGDWCLLAVFHDRPERARYVVAHRDASRAGPARALERHLATGAALPFGAEGVLRSGRARLLEEAAPLAPDGLAGEEGRLLRELGTSSALVVPLSARGAAFGAMAFVSGGAGRGVSADDVPFAEEVARRASLALENARLYEEAREAVAVRDEFITVASHELRTPLTSLTLLLEQQRRQARREGLSGGGLETVEKAMRQTKRLSRLIANLLDVSRITTGRLVLAREEFDLCEAVQEIADRFAEEARVQGSRIDVTRPPSIVGSWDRLGVEQVITNLLSNALRYGAGEPVEVSLEPTPEAVRIVVRDHGIGIAPEDVARIFGRFERAVSARHYGGLGLGLFIARQIVEAHGGAVSVESSPQDGSTFTVDLPREPAPFESARRQAPDATPHAGSPG